MSPEFYRGDFTTELDEKETELIMRNIRQLTSITECALGDLEVFDKDRDEVTIYDNNEKTTGIKIAAALYGEPQPLFGRNGMGYEQSYKITIGKDYVEILLNPDDSMKGIETNILRNKPYSVHIWLMRAYSVINDMLNDPFYYYFRRESST